LHPRLETTEKEEKLAEETGTGSKQTRCGRCLKKGKENNNNIWKVVSKRWIDTERQKWKQI
jgi:hypothetical protein